MAKENEWGADPAKYKRMAKPFEDAEHGKVAANAFLSDVRKLREKHRIPELSVQFYVYCKGEKGQPQYMQGGAGWGNQARQAELSKAMFDREFDHLCAIVMQLAERMPNVRRAMLTDPADYAPETESAPEGESAATSTQE